MFYARELSIRALSDSYYPSQLSGKIIWIVGIRFKILGICKDGRLTDKRKIGFWGRQIGERF